MSRKRILYVHSRKASFIAIDRAILAERFELEDLYQPGRLPNPIAVIGGVLRADLVFAWFANWHSFLPITLAWLLRKPSVLIIGGFDTANMPDIGFGHQRGGLRTHASRWIFRRAGRLITHSNYTLSEIERNTPIPASRVRVLHLGVPDPFGEDPPAKDRAALTVGAIDRTTLVQKGQLPFVLAARELPDVSFVFAGKWLDDSVEELRAQASPNVEFTGWLSDEDLLALYRRCAVYVQASRHEGFGLAVAEAMLAGCVPVRDERDRDARGGGRRRSADRVTASRGRGRRNPAGARARAGRGPPGARAYSHELSDGEPEDRDPASGGRGACRAGLSAR